MTRVPWTARRANQSILKEINPEGLWKPFTERADAKTPILWPPDVKSQLIGKDPGAGPDRGQEEKEVMGDEIVEWRHWLNTHESEQTLQQ